MAEDDSTEKVCVIGLGNMGAALASALLAKGHPVTVWNRTPEKCEPLVAAGATCAASAEDAAAGAEFAVACVTDHRAACSVLLNEAMANALRGKTLLQTTTMSADESLELDHWTSENGIAYLEGSILGLPDDVIKGSATMIYGGPEAAIAKHRSALEALGSVQHVSEEFGSAVTFDRVIYAYVYGTMQAFIQGAAMAHARGFPIDVYTNTVVQRSATLPWKLQFFTEMMKKRNYDDVQAALSLHAGAFRETLDMCRALNVDDTLPAAIMSNFDLAIEAGLGEKEIAALFEVLVDSKT